MPLEFVRRHPTQGISPTIKYYIPSISNPI